MGTNGLTTEQADAIFRATPYLEDLDDYAYEPGTGHVYILTDGRQFLIGDDGEGWMLDRDGVPDDAALAIVLREPGRDVLIADDGTTTVIPRADA